MVRCPGLEPDLDVGAALLADELAVEGLRRAGRVDVVDPVVRALVGDPGRLERVGMDLAVRVPEPGLEQRLAHGPGHRLVDAGTRTDRLLAVVEAGRRVVVPGEEHGIPLGDQIPHLFERDLERRQPDPFLGGEDLAQRDAVVEQARPVVDVVEVDVEEHDDLAGAHLDERVPALGSRRLVDRIPRQDLQAGVVVLVAGVLGDLGQAVVRLQDADDVGVDVADHRVGRAIAAVLDVVDEDVEGNRLAGRRGPGRRRIGRRRMLRVDV